MITLLSKLFIKDRNNTQSPAVRQAYGTLSSMVGIFLNILLFAAKYLAGTLTGSIAITADAFNNLSDAGSSIITLFGFKLAAKKPNREHPYGHGRFEYLAGLFVSVAIILMGYELGRDSISKIISPEPVSFSLVSIFILAGSMLVKLYMAFYNRSIGKKIHSVAIIATASDSLSDLCATGVVLLSTLFEHFTGIGVDAYTGTAVAIVILWVGIKSAKETISPLLGNVPDPEFVSHISQIVSGYPEILAIHDLLVHDYGAGRIIISLHAEVPANGDIVQLHDIIDRCEQQLQNELNCSACIHLDPISTDDEVITQTRSQVLNTLHEELSKDIQIHDFRMVSGPTHTNVIFDAVIPFELMSEAEAKEKIRQIVNHMNPAWFAVVNIDRPYT